MRRVWKKKEQGEIMLEGLIVTIITTLMLIWILAIGFVYYQRYLLTAVTNDAAAKVAATYSNPGSDLVMGYISCNELSGRDLYRGFTNNALFELNQSKAQAYVCYILEQRNFAGTIDNVEVNMKLVADSALRKHITIETTCTFNTPFGAALKLFGMSSQQTYTATSSADCTDIADYISTVDFASYQLSGNAVSSKVISLINSLISFFNHRYARS